MSSNQNKIKSNKINVDVPEKFMNNKSAIIKPKQILISVSWFLFKNYSFYIESDWL